MIPQWRAERDQGGWSTVGLWHGAQVGDADWKIEGDGGDAARLLLSKLKDPFDQRQCFLLCSNQRSKEITGLASFCENLTGARVSLLRIPCLTSHTSPRI